MTINRDYKGEFTAFLFTYYDVNRKLNYGCRFCIDKKDVSNFINSPVPIEKILRNYKNINSKALTIINDSVYRLNNDEDINLESLLE